MLDECKAKDSLPNVDDGVPSYTSTSTSMYEQKHNLRQRNTLVSGSKRKRLPTAKSEQKINDENTIQQGSQNV